MNLRTALAAAGMVAALGVPATSAFAQNTVDLAHVASDVGTSILTLQRDQRDFDGHRVRAIAQLRKAYGQLRAAARWAATHGYGYAVAIPPAPPPDRVPYAQYSQATSDQTIVDASRNVPNWIAQLQGDGRDYGGHRVAAIQRLQFAETELNLAHAWFGSHGGY